jgi:hypothetical protein
MTKSQVLSMLGRPDFMGGLSIYATRIVVQRKVLHACALEPVLRISARSPLK